MRGDSAVAATAWAVGAWCASGAISPEAANWSSRIGVLAPLWLLGVLLVGALAVAAVARPSARSCAPLWLPLLALLPWLPIPLPPAALLAVGPLGQLLAATSAVVCFVAAAFARRGVHDVRTTAATSALLLTVLFGASAWWVSPRIPGGDEPHYLIITQSLLHDGDLRIENNHQRREYAVYVDGELKPDYLRRGRDGAIYSIHAPGISAMVAPAFVLGGYPGAVLMFALLGAVGVLAAWGSARQVTGSLGAASVGAVGVGLSVPFFFQTFTIYPDGPAAVAVALVVWLAVARREELTWQRALACGALLGALPWLHTRYAAIAGPLGLVVLGRVVWPRSQTSWPPRAHALAALTAPALVSGIAWLAMFQSIYGTWDPRAPYGHATDMRWARIPHGLGGLLLDQQFGLLPNAPIYLLALAGFVALWRRDRRLTAELVIATAPYVAAVAGFHMWWAGRSSPARFLVPVLLPLAAPLAAWWVAATSRTARATTIALLGATLCLTATMVLVDHGALIYNSRDGHALWLLAANPSVNLTYAVPSLFQAGLATACGIAAAWAAAAGLGWLTLRQAERRSPSTGPWLACVLGVATLVIGGGTSFGWAFSSAAPWDAGKGLITLAARACDRDAIGVGASPVRAGRAAVLLRGLTIPDASRRPPQAGAPSWAAENVPAGRYRVSVFSGLNASGTVTVALGRPDQVMTTCALREQAPGTTGCEIDLPAGAAALWLSGDATLGRTADHLAVTLVEPGAASACGLRAQRAIATPAGVLFVVGGRAWTEGGGLWTEGGGEVALVAGGSSPAALHIRQGGAGGAIVVTAGEWTARRELAPGEVWDLDLPRQSADKTGAFTISTAAAFRPADVDPSSRDTRLLGAWIEPR